MTGRRPPRGAGNNPWRGGRPSDGGLGTGVPGTVGTGAPRHAEVEELGVQQVSQRRRNGVGLAPAIATLALVGLLAGGLGLLGGRPEASPAASPVATGGAVVRTPSPTAPTRSPAVTPFADCGPDPVPPAVPVMLLQSNGVPTPGLVELASGPDLPATAQPGIPFPEIRGPRVEVRPDVITELWIQDGTCAFEWSIELLDPVSEGAWVLHEARNPQADTTYAFQNRFNLSHALADHRGIGRDLQFGGVFVFRTVVVRAFWTLRIQPLDRPVGQLVTSDGGPTPIVEGCDVAMTLGNGWSDERRSCATDLSGTLDEWREVEVGEPLHLVLDGWATENLTVICGRLSDLAFVAEPEPGCFLESPEGQPFEVPDLSGRWTLAVSACANSMIDSIAMNRVCGTWYANVEIVEERDEG